VALQVFLFLVHEEAEAFPQIFNRGFSISEHAVEHLELARVRFGFLLVFFLLLGVVVLSAGLSNRGHVPKLDPLRQGILNVGD